MLSIKPIGSSRSEVAYYATLGTEDYYAKDSDEPGRWWGRGAAALGLKGTVEADALSHLLTGFSPDGSTKLVQNAGDKRRRAAFDLTFSAPKSVSVLWSQLEVDDRRAVEAACEAALERTLAELNVFCGATRRGRSGERTERAGLVGAIFRHDTARGVDHDLPDPNLHFHAVIGNVSVRADRTTGALDARPLFRRHMKMTLGALFRAELSAELERLGLTSHRPERECGKKASWFELDGIPKGAVREFSKRRSEIEAWLDDHGGVGAKDSERAALSTRRKKYATTRPELFAAWQAVGSRYGLERVLPSRERPHQKDALGEAQLAAKRAVGRITEERAHFSELELLRFTAEEAQTSGAGIDAVKRAVQEALFQSDEIVQLEGPGDENRYTTREMLQVELEMLTGAESLAKKESHRVEAEVLSGVMSSHPTLRAEQRNAVRYVVEAGDLACINGMAGTGKTYLLSVAREALERAGYDVTGTALAAKAARGLEEGSGIPATHVHVLLREIASGKRKLGPRSVLVVDEAGMVGTRLMKEIVELSEAAGAKLVLVGDHRQLQAISAGSPFRGIAERTGCMELRDVVRQRERWAREAVHELASGEAYAALRRLDEHGCLHLALSRKDAMRELVADWMGSLGTGLKLEETLILAGTNLEVSVINRLCQAARVAASQLEDERIETKTGSFYVGDRVLFTRNNARLLVRNGTTGTVLAGSPGEESLRVRTDDGLLIRVDTAAYEHLRLGYCLTTHKAQGATAERTFVLSGGEMTDRELSYVQGSRSRGRTDLYTDYGSAGPELERLGKFMSRSRAKDLASDYLLERV